MNFTNEKINAIASSLGFPVQGSAQPQPYNASIFTRKGDNYGEALSPLVEGEEGDNPIKSLSTSWNKEVTVAVTLESGEVKTVTNQISHSETSTRASYSAEEYAEIVGSEEATI